MSPILSTHVGDCLPWLQAMPTDSVDMVLTSPPYEDCRSYENGNETKFKLRGQKWVDWLAPIVRECTRVSRGPVILNIASPVRDRSYSPSVEWLVADLTRMYPVVCAASPYAWVKSAGTPGSGGPQYHRRDWEPIYAFVGQGKLPLPFAAPLAFGEPCKTGPGGEFSNRTKSGRRVGQTNWRRVYEPPAVANPGNVIRAKNGGGHMGDELASEGEAPMNLAIAERFVRWYCPVGGLVADPFCGSGTTAVAAYKWRRRALVCDIRANQIELTRRRVAITKMENL